MSENFSEEDMYQPIKTFFESINYKVNGEVKHCDITMIKDDRLIVIELKKSFNITLVFQAMDRQKMADEVYVAIPRFKKNKGSTYAQTILLIKKLGLGLITIAMDSPIKTVEILVFPEMSNVKINIKKKNKVLEEVSNRTFDLNKGGMTKQKIMTAFRERSIRIACILNIHGKQKASSLVKNYGCYTGSYSIMYRNDYGWFEKCGDGFFQLSQLGKEELNNPKYKSVVDYYSLDENIT